MNTNSLSRRSLGLIFFVMLMDIIGISILMPIAPYIVSRYSGNASMVTLLTVIYAAAQFFSAPILGKISDRVGRRPVLLGCVFGSAVGYFIFGIGGALWVLLLSRLIDGITGGNLSTASAYIVDLSKPEERAKNMTLIGIAYGLGFILGPAIGGALGQISLNAPVFAAGTISLISVIFIYFMLPESLERERRATTALRASDFNPFASIREMLARPGLGALLVVAVLFNFVFDGYNSVMGVYVLNRFNPTALETGLLYVIAGIGTAFVQATLVRRLVPRFGEKQMALTSLIGAAVGGLLFIASPSLGLLYPMAFLQYGITGFFWSTVGAMSSRCVSSREQGLLAGVNAALSGLVAALGPLWAGAMYDQLAPTSPFWIGAGILIVACLVILRVKPRPRPREVEVLQTAGD
ncbi:MAG TPA: MFS transporter [Anaerolineaceae bacterium]|nr:MFS transporter [Anaerolineaceae bacterium]